MAQKYLPALYPSRHHAMNREAKNPIQRPSAGAKSSSIGLRRCNRPAAWPVRLRLAHGHPVSFTLASDFEQVLNLRTCA